MADEPVIQGETVDQPPKGKGRFKAGDPRINRKGRPKNFDKLRALAQSIAIEPISGTVNGEVVVWTRVEAILRAWAMSKNPQAQEKFVQYAYGKVPDEAKISGDLKMNGVLPVQIVDYAAAIKPLAPSEGDVSEDDA